jgi:hypothetical protein
MVAVIARSLRSVRAATLLNIIYIVRSRSVRDYGNCLAKSGALALRLYRATPQRRVNG